VIRLLAIGNDPTIALPVTVVQGDTHQRQLKYASILERYHLITQTPQDRPVASQIQLAGNFWVHACGRRGMASYLVDAVRTGWRIVHEAGIQVVSTQDPFVTGLAGFCIARRFGLPLSLQFVANAVDNPFWLKEKPYYRALNTLAHWLIARADTYRVVSEEEKWKLIRLGVPAQRIWNLPSITDFGRFLAADGRIIRERYLRGPSAPALASGDRRLVLSVARFAPQKDISTLLRAFSLLSQNLPGATLLLVGSGSLEQALRRQVKKLGLEGRVTFAGAVPYEALPAYYAACDVLVLSSLYEGNARVLAEAAASARPVVSTAVSGASDTIKEGETGYIVPIGDSQALAGRLGVLLADPVGAKRMGELARSHILDLYAPEKLLAGFTDLWDTTAKKRMRG